MGEATTGFKHFLQDKRQRVLEFYDRAQTTIRSRTEKGRERIEELIGHLSVAELVERLRTDGFFRSDLFTQLGLAERSRLQALEERLDAIESRFAEIEAQIAAVAASTQSASKTAKKAAKKGSKKATKADKSGAKARRTTAGEEPKA